jgi:hypothetical protein
MVNIISMTIKRQITTNVNFFNLAFVMGENEIIPKQTMEKWYLMEIKMVNR